MSCGLTPVLTTTPDPEAANPEAANLGEEWAEAHVRLLRRAAVSAVNAIEALERQVVAAAQTPAGTQELGYDPGLALPRLARMLRLTLSMEADLHKERLALRLEAQQATQADQRARAQAHEAAAPDLEGKKTTVREAVELAIDPDGEDEAPGAQGRDTERRDALRDDLTERLNDWDDEDFLARPVGDLVCRFCRALGIEIDEPHLWDEEEWAIEEAEGGLPVRRFIRAAAAGGSARGSPIQPP
jgi:hypothetical protein